MKGEIGLPVDEMKERMEGQLKDKELQPSSKTFWSVFFHLLPFLSFSLQLSLSLSVPPPPA